MSTNNSWKSSLASMALALGLGCGGDDGAGSDTQADAESTGGSSCVPGQVASCPCVDGSMGTQTCNTDGDAFGPCDCGSGTGSGSMTTTSGSEESTGAGSESGSTTEADTSTSGTTVSGCMAGDVAACECGDGPGYQQCTDGGDFGPCECCQGSHPLVEGMMRFCEEGNCYCGDLDAMPAIDVCYSDVFADVCCPGDIDLECY